MARKDEERLRVHCKRRRNTRPRGPPIFFFFFFLNFKLEGGRGRGEGEERREKEEGTSVFGHSSVVFFTLRMQEVRDVQEALLNAADVCCASNCILFTLPCAEGESLPVQDCAVINDAFKQYEPHSLYIFAGGFLFVVVYVKNKVAAFRPCGLPRGWAAKNVKLGGKSFSLSLTRHALPLNAAVQRNERIEKPTSPLREPTSLRMMPKHLGASEVVHGKCASLEADLAAAMARINVLEDQAKLSASLISAAEAAASLLTRRVDELEAGMRGLRPQLQAAMYTARQQQQQRSMGGGKTGINEPWVGWGTRQ